MKEISYIILGWLLGLLGHPIVSRIERYFKRKDLKVAIFSDLENLIVKLAAMYYSIQSILGCTDKATLKWIKSIYEKHRVDCPKSVLEAINRLLLCVPDEEFNKINLLKADSNTSLSLKIYAMPFIEPVLEQLSVFDSKFQADILEIRNQLDILNQEIEDTIFYHRLTFDPSCMDTNANIINNNLTNSYNNIQERCKIVVDKIDKFLEN